MERCKRVPRQGWRENLARIRGPVNRHHVAERIHSLELREHAQGLRMHGSGQQEENNSAPNYHRRILPAGRTIRNPVLILWRGRVEPRDRLINPKPHQSCP